MTPNSTSRKLRQSYSGVTIPASCDRTCGCRRSRLWSATAVGGHAVRASCRKVSSGMTSSVQPSRYVVRFVSGRSTTGWSHESLHFLGRGARSCVPSPVAWLRVRRGVGDTITLWKFPNPAGLSRISLIDPRLSRLKGVPMALVNKRYRPNNTADSRCIKSRQVPQK